MHLADRRPLPTGLGARRRRHRCHPRRLGQQLGDRRAQRRAVGDLAGGAGDIGARSRRFSPSADRTRRHSRNGTAQAGCARPRAPAFPAVNNLAKGEKDRHFTERVGDVNLGVGGEQGAGRAPPHAVTGGRRFLGDCVARLGWRGTMMVKRSGVAAAATGGRRGRRSPRRHGCWRPPTAAGRRQRSARRPNHRPPPVTVARPVQAFGDGHRRRAKGGELRFGGGVDGENKSKRLNSARHSGHPSPALERARRQPAVDEDQRQVDGFAFDDRVGPNLVFNENGDARAPMGSV